MAKVELRDVGARRFRLLRRGGEDLRAVLRAHVGPLAVHLGRVQGDREEEAEDLPVGDLCRVVADPHRLGVARGARAHGRVVRSLRRAARVAGDGALDAADVLEHALHAPEAAACEHDGLLAMRGRGDLLRGWR